VIGFVKSEVEKCPRTKKKNSKTKTGLITKDNFFNFCFDGFKYYYSYS